MHSRRYDYCKVFVRDTDRDAVLNAAISGLGARPLPFFSAETDTVTIDIRLNDDHDEDHGENFLFWPIYIDVTRKNNGADETVRDTAAKLLESLWRGDVDAVAACKFEDELPRAGGHRP